MMEKETPFDALIASLNLQRAQAIRQAENQNLMAGMLARAVDCAEEHRTLWLREQAKPGASDV